MNNSKLKILFLSPMTPPFYGSALSSEMCLNILKSNKLFSVTNIKLNYSQNIHDIGVISIFKIFGLWKVLKEISRKIEIFNPDIIYIVPATSGLGLIRDSIFIRKINKIRKGKLIVHLRSQFLPSYEKNIFWKNFKKSILRCDRLILIGKELISNLNGLVNHNNIYILPNAIPQTIYNKEFEIIFQRKKTSELSLLFLSNMEESKGWFKVLETCKLLKENNILYFCNFVGDWGSKSEKLKFTDYVECNNLTDNIKYHGRLINENKNEILKNTDILIFPTEYKLETFGRVIIEAMEYGIPVIANTIATTPSIIEHGKNGFLLSDNSPEEILEYVIKLNDEELRKQIGYKARETFIQKYTLEIFSPNFIEKFKFIDK